MSTITEMIGYAHSSIVEKLSQKFACRDQRWVPSIHRAHTARQTAFGGSDGRICRRRRVDQATPTMTKAKLWQQVVANTIARGSADSRKWDPCSKE